MTNYYTTPDKVRSKLGLNDDDVDDETIYHYIEEAQQDFLDDIAIYIEDDELDGSINTTNTTFETSKLFIADRNFNLTVDSLDVTVYGWIDEDDPSTKVSLTVSTIYPSYGKIILASAPSAYTIVTADYYYYPHKILTTQFSEACAYLSAYKFAMQEFALTPEQWMHGAYRFKTGSEWKNLYKEYLAKKERIVASISEKGEHDEATLIRGE